MRMLKSHLRNRPLFLTKPDSIAKYHFITVSVTMLNGFADTTVCHASSTAQLHFQEHRS